MELDVDLLLLRSARQRAWAPLRRKSPARRAGRGCWPPRWLRGPTRAHMRHGEAAGAAHRRLQPWLHFALLGFWLKAPLALDFPPCNWTYCPVCFPDAKTELQNLTVQGRDGLRYSTPLRLAGQMDFWDSQAGLGQIVGILTEEKLGIRVEYVPCEDEFACVKAISGCADRDNGCQLVDTEAQGQQFYTQGLKRYPDALPDVFAAVEVWNTALDRSVYPVPLQDIWMDRDSMELGTAGFAVQDGLYLPRSAVDEAWIEDTVSLRVFSFLTKKSFLKYVASPKQITRGGVTALEPGCSSDNEVVNTGISVLVELGYVCVDSWWLTPACAALGDRWQEDCFAVLDDDWGYIKAELYGAMATSDMLAAKLTVGYESMNAVISSRKFTVAFCWWSTDTQYLDLEPVRISLPEESDPQRVIVSKEVYRPVLDNLQVKVLLSQMNMNNKELDAILKNVSETVQHRPAAAIATWDYFQKVACDWIRSNEARWQAWLPDSRSCQPGEYYDTDAARCAACPAGSRWERGRGSSPNRCLACAAGSFSAVPGQSACQLCPPGQFLNYTGGVACRPCAIGRVATSTGSRSCVWCSANRSTPALWTTMRLAEGAEQWILTDGAADMRACGCSPGSFQIDEGHCMVCTEGMRCDGMGSGVPETLPGYYATLSQPFSIYECLDREICPGGPPETCAGAHLGLVCALCPQGRRRGSCGECAAYARVLILICPVLVVIFVALLYYSSTVTVTVNASVSLTASVWLGMVMTCFQVFSLVGGMNIEWPGSGSSSYFAGTSITMLNLDQFAPECAIGQEAVLLYLLRVLTPPLVLAAAVVVWAASRLLSRCGSSIPCVDADRMVNTVGQVLQLFFIPFAVIATRALECKRHPNGTKSMVLFPEVLCFTQGHVTLLGLSVLLNLLFLVPYFALTIWVIAVAPNRTGAGVVVGPRIPHSPARARIRDGGDGQRRPRADHVGQHPALHLCLPAVRRLAVEEHGAEHLRHVHDVPADLHRDHQRIVRARSGRQGADVLHGARALCHLHPHHHRRHGPHHHRAVLPQGTEWRVHRHTAGGDSLEALGAEVDLLVQVLERSGPHPHQRRHRVAEPLRPHDARLGPQGLGGGLSRRRGRGHSPVGHALQPLRRLGALDRGHPR